MTGVFFWAELYMLFWEQEKDGVLGVKVSLY